MEQNTKKNMILVYIHTFLSTFILYYICDTLFFIERGLVSSQYISFVGISFFIKIILEIPFGIIADRKNKKKILLISNLFFVISTLIFIFSHNYISFLIAIIINAINNALSSGIVNSILYENTKNKEKFNKVLFYNSFFYNISYMFAMIVGGYIGQRYGLIYTYWITLIPFIIDFFIITMIRINNHIENKSNENNIEVLKNGIKEIKKSSYLLQLILKSAIMFAGIKLVEESHPEYASNIGLSVLIIGIYTALILVFCILGSYIGSKIKKDKYNLILSINPIIVGICILMVGILNNHLGIICILIIYIFSESFDNIMKAKLHNSISSKSRVTVESINQFALGLCGFIFSVLMAILLKNVNLNVMYICIGSIIIIFNLINIVRNKIKSGFFKKKMDLKYKYKSNSRKGII